MGIWNKKEFVHDVVEAVTDDYTNKRRGKFRDSTQVLCFMLSDQKLTDPHKEPESLNEAKAVLRQYYDHLKTSSKNAHDLEHHIIDYLDAVKLYLNDLL